MTAGDLGATEDFGLKLREIADQVTVALEIGRAHV